MIFMVYAHWDPDYRMKTKNNLTLTQVTTYFLDFLRINTFQTLH